MLTTSHFLKSLLQWLISSSPLSSNIKSREIFMSEHTIFRIIPNVYRRFKFASVRWYVLKCMSYECFILGTLFPRSLNDLLMGPWSTGILIQTRRLLRAGGGDKLNSKMGNSSTNFDFHHDRTTNHIPMIFQAEITRGININYKN